MVRQFEGKVVWVTGASAGIGECAARLLVEAIREERFHVLPHPEVEEYVRRKGDNVDRWLVGMRRLRRQTFDGAE